MPENLFNLIHTLLITCVWLLIVVGIIVRIAKNKHAPTKTVKAVVIDKHKLETFSKYSGNGKREKHVVVFRAEGRKVSFYVSEFSYDGYKINETGTLTYKGDKLIAFK